MSEVKTFGELSLYDKLYYATETDYGSYGIKRIEDDDNDNQFVCILTDNGDDFTVPRDETIYEKEDFVARLTTDKRQLNIWAKPFAEEKIKQKRKQIAALEDDIKELEESIKS